MGLDFQKVQGHVRVRFQVKIHRALARAGLVVTITVWKPLLTLQHVHRCTSLVECCYLHHDKGWDLESGEEATQCGMVMGHQVQSLELENNCWYYCRTTLVVGQQVGLY